MHISDLNGKSVCILGFGREGKAMVTALNTYAPDARVTIADKNPKTDTQGLPLTAYSVQLGESWLENLDTFDVIIKSPGIPPSSQLKTQSSKLTSSTQIFLDTIESSGALTIGVTGSKGKSTTASLIHHLIETLPPIPYARTLLVGNIGDPAIAHLADAKKDTIFVMEMSSYQLMDLRTAPHIAVITSFFPEHLDYHASTVRSTGLTPLEAYRNAKANITRLQKSGDIVFYADTEGVRPMVAGTHAKRIPVTAKQAPLPLSDTKLIGDHNLSNLALAGAVASHLGVDSAGIGTAMRSFTPLPHRLQSLGIRDGIEWIDDAISTTPDSAIAAIEALGDRVKVIILGGQDRGLDFTELGTVIDTSSIDTVILFGENSTRIGKTITQKITIPVHSMHEVITTTIHALRNHQTSTPIALLSPASPSYDSYSNFEEKGEDFRAKIGF
ncbi:UDP-N-acetylmuramoyl-L-alanine--D-glutamate ligase [Candidatus Peregrinibacteria bacterium]|nr:UDP-N-acetylmuramoyl-L-alanine--D-glutamate ligase [Candidatus Peregrinibacteria bacterium]